MAERPFDIILWGCTGFTGGLVAEYFASSAPRGVRWALAGRTRSKLQAVKANLIKLNADCEQLEILEADISDQNSLEALAAQTKVILSTAGPFTLCGTPIVDACVKQSTSYCDITGESPWVKGLIEKYHEEALAKNIHIVPMCGFDSVPFDLGAFMLAQEAQQHGGAKWIRGYAESNGRPSGGTLHTILLLSGTVPTSVMANPRLLNPANHANDPLPAGAKDQALPRYDSYIKSWTGPFVMAGVNTRVVRRSQCLYADAGRPYGPAGFFYNESEIHKGFFSALISTLGLGVFATLLFFSLGRAFLRRVVPSPGQGPSAETRAKSWFRVRFVCEAVDGTILKGQVSGGDPGYTETAKMISNAALSLLDKEALPSPGGVLTPATAMGNTLIERLRNAGMTFQLDHRTIRNVWA